MNTLEALASKITTGLTDLDASLHENLQTCTDQDTH